FTKKPDSAGKKYFSDICAEMPLEKLAITKAIRGAAIPRAKVARAVAAACAESKKAINAQIVFVSDAKIRALHRDFMNDNSATDVLSFVLQEDADNLEAEIYVSVDRARAQAAENRVSLQNELVRLAAHGALHVVGYDDRTPRKRSVMWKRQEVIVEEIFRQPERRAQRK